MKLLIVTQVIDKNHPILGFFHRWVEEFAKHFEHINVIALQVGEYDLPENVKVHSLGKEYAQARASRALARIKYVMRFYKLIWKYRKDYDAVFVHMNPEYIVLAGALWKLWNKKVSLWYTHKNVDLKLRIAEIFVENIFTASSESLLLNTSKKKVMNHGIDVPEVKRNIEKGLIISVGRIDKTKQPDKMIKVLAEVREEVPGAHLMLVGPIESTYKKELDELIKNLGLSEAVEFIGAVKHESVFGLLSRAEIFLNMSQTGSLDKAVLEAMSVGVVPVTSNVGLKGVLGEYDLFCDESALSKKITFLMRENKEQLSEKMKDVVGEKHSLVTLIYNIKKYININQLFYYVLYGAMPTKRAYGAQVAHMCQAFKQAGYFDALIVPKGDSVSIKDFYRLQEEINTIRIGRHYSTSSRFLFRLQMLFFSLRIFIYLLTKKRATIYGRDEMPLIFASIAGHKVFYEAHQPRWNIFTKLLNLLNIKFVCISGGLEEFYKNKGVRAEHITVAHDGVPEEWINTKCDRRKARKTLGLPQDKNIILYVGRLDEWKGVRTLAAASELLPQDTIIAMVGNGPIKDELKRKYSKVIFCDETKYDQLPKILCAGNILSLPNTAQDETSAKYTSPLKLFAYMASGIPIIASDLPSICEILDKDSALLVSPDDPSAIADAVEKASSINQTNLTQLKSKAETYTWQNRADAIINFLR